MKNKSVVLGLVILVYFLLVGGFFYLGRFAFLPAKKVIIPFGASAEKISQILKDEKIISSPAAFKILVKILGWEKKLKNGVYLLKPSFFPLAVAKTIKDGRAIQIPVTIPEGFTLEQIAERFEAELGIPKTEFLKIAFIKNFSEKFSFLPSNSNRSLEGYLFPDTYNFISFGISPEQVMAPMLKRFGEVIWGVWSETGEKLKIKNRVLTLDEVVILASIVERETQTAGERPLVAGVFWNRLKRGWPLEACSTINFILKDPHLVLTFKELKIKSAYNTYRYPGLPPGPIASPGLEAVKAVLDPQKTDYLYFVAASDNGHVFSRTLKEHFAAQQKFFQKNLEKQNAAN